MSLPMLPPFFDMIYTKSDGKLAADGYLYNDQMFQVLNLAINLINTIVSSSISSNNMIANNGLTPPLFTTTQITALVPNSVIGTIWFNTTLAKLQVLTAPGVVQTITST
jgi:hypothetical protein